MPMLPSRLFLSETDAFLRDYRRAHPESVDQQKKGMRLWWNQPAETVFTRREMDRAGVAQTPYMYDAGPDRKQGE